MIGPQYRDLTLRRHTAGGHPAVNPQTLQDLAKRLDLHPEEVPAELVTIWREGAIDWPVYWPGQYVPVTGVEPEGPHKVVGVQRFRFFTLAPGRGYLLIAYYDPSLTRVLRLPPPQEPFIIRPKAGLEAMMEHHHLSDSDIGRHLWRIHRGRAVDWSEVLGYVN